MGSPYSERNAGARGQSLFSLCGVGHSGQLSLPSATVMGFPALDLGAQGLGRCEFSFSRHGKLVFPSEIPPF